MSHPSLAILIPHYNYLEGLMRSIRSISYSLPYQIIVVDDGSSKSQRPDVSRLSEVNSNVTILYFEENKGIEHALNFGLHHILKSNQFNYIARLDCGDTCCSDRLNKQAQFLTENPNYNLVGSYVEFLSTKGSHRFTFSPPTQHEDITRQMVFNNCFSHPAVMFRSSALEQTGLYPTNYKAAEDYALFYKFVKLGKTANLAEVLTIAENNSSGISTKSRKKQIVSRLKIIARYSPMGISKISSLIKNGMMLIIPYSWITYWKSFQ